MLELPKVFRNILNVSAAEISIRKQNLKALLCSIIVKVRKMHSWSFGKHKRNYITDNDIDMKFGPDVMNSAAKSWKK